jgi:hypothetical protein
MSSRPASVKLVRTYLKNKRARGIVQVVELFKHEAPEFSSQHCPSKKKKKKIAPYSHSWESVN